MGRLPIVVMQRGCLVDIPCSVRTNPNTGVQGVWLWASDQILSKSGDFHIFACLMGHISILGLYCPNLTPFHPLNTKVFENDLQIRILNPKIVLGTKIHRNQIIFILLHFWWVISHLWDILPLFHSRFTP